MKPTAPRHAAVPAFSLALLAAVCAAPAMAGTLTYPGTMCQSEGAVERPTNGALLNAEPGSTQITKFHCPIIRTRSNTDLGGAMMIALNAKLNLSQNWLCVVRVTTPNGLNMDTTPGVLPAKSSNNQGFWTANISVTLPPGLYSSVNLRCNVPNVAGETAGIMSYTVID